MTKFDFVIGSGAQLQLSVPDIPEKINYYYKPTAQLHQFDEGTVRFMRNAIDLVLVRDIIGEIIVPLCIGIEAALSNTLPMPREAHAGMVGVALNELLEDDERDEPTPYWILSNPHQVATLLYNADDEVFLEIAPLYPWLFSERDDATITFDEFIASYKPYAVERVSRPVLEQWHDQCAMIISQLGLDDLARRCGMRGKGPR